jgi:hypothetical protein
MKCGGRIERLFAAQLPMTLRGTDCMPASANAVGLTAQVALLGTCSYAKRYVSEQLHKILRS